MGIITVENRYSPVEASGSGTHVSDGAQEDGHNGRSLTSSVSYTH